MDITQYGIQIILYIIMVKALFNALMKTIKKIFILTLIEIDMNHVMKLVLHVMS